MTEEEKTLLINEIVDYLISHSQSVEGIPETTDLDGVSSLPAIKEILNEESQVVRVSLDSILPEFRYYSGYVQYRFSNGEWINLFQVPTSLDGYATKDYVDLKVSEVISNAPVTLNTLNKIAAALNYDPNFYQNIYQDINAKWTTDNAKIAQWDQAYADRHVHDNISSLQLINDILIDKWNQAYTWGDHSQAGYEYDLGNPVLSGQILSSDTNGHRSWVDMYQHPVSGVVPNIYTKVTVDINGHVTYGTSLVKDDIPSISWNQVQFDRPNTIEGYGITDAYTKLYIDRYLQRKYSGIVDIDQIIIDGNTISVPSCKANLYDNAGFKGYVSPYNIAAKSFTLTGEEVRYIVISYNGGSPEYVITQERSMINYSNVIPVITLIYDGAKIHSVNWDEQANGLSERLLKRLNRTQRFQRDGGLLINVDGSRTITISQSTIYFGASEVVYPSSSSSTNLIYQYHHSDGVWTYTRSQFLNNLEYDNGTGLVSLSNDNRYTVNWVYAGVGDDGDIITVLGTGDYKLDEVINAQPPSILPDIIRFHGILVGKVIYQKGLNIPYQVISISEQSISSGGSVVEHNNLNGLQGGLAQEFYHLSHSEYLTARDNNTFTSQAGTYRSVTTDSKGRVVSGTNPTTLSDYGIDDTDVTDRLLTGYTLGLNTEVSASDNILSAFGKLQSYINNRQGTVTSIGLNVPTGFSVGNSPITNSGTISINFATGYSLPSNVNQSNWTSAYDYSLIEHLPLAGGNVTGNIGLVGDLNISGNIYQNGSNYITHTENIYSKNDYIYMREGSSSGLLPGTYSGFEFVNYDGVNNGRLVIDVNGVAKVGDVGEEQPLATREESPLNLGFAYWDSLTNRFKTKTISFSEIIDKPTTLSGYGITDAVTLNTSQDILDTKTFKKSGFGSSINIWSNLDGSNSSISFYNGLSKTLLGYIGISDTGSPSYWDSLLNDYILLHSGNYDDYALSLLGGTLVGVLDVNNSTNSTSTTTGSIKTTGGIGVIGNGYFGGNVTAVTFIGALSGNAATATKLQTTRAIAGVSFDGSSDISIPFSNLTSKPTTLSGYGITDGLLASAYTATDVLNKIKTVDGSGSGLDADYLRGYTVNPGSSTPFNKIPFIGSAGVMEVGGYIDMHYDNTGSFDYSTRLRCQGNYENSVNLPTASGTLALLSDNVASATRLQTARTIAGVSFDGTTNIAIPFANLSSIPTTLSGYGITDGQPLSADLVAIAALTGTSGLLRKTAANTWSLDTNASLTEITKAQVEGVLTGNITTHTHSQYLTGNQTITLSGDATGSGTTSIALTLANSGVTAGTYNNSATQVSPFTVDAKGRITSIGTDVTIQPAWGSITSKPTTLLGYGITDAYTKTQMDTRFAAGMDIDTETNILSLLDGVGNVLGTVQLPSGGDNTTPPIEQSEYTMLEIDESIADGEAISNTGNQSGYKYGNDYVPSGHINKILNARHRVLGKYTANGTMTVAQLHDANSTFYADAEVAANGTPAVLTGAEGDVFMYEPNYWYKGINDILNKKKYNCFSFNTSVPTPALSVKKTLDQMEQTVDGFGINMAPEYTTLTAAKSVSTPNSYCVISVQGYKRVRFPSVNSSIFGAAFIDASGNILRRMKAVSGTGMIDGMYLFSDIPQEAVKLAFTIFNTAPFDYVLLTNSMDIEAIEPDWVKHEECLTGVYEACLLNNKLYSRSGVISTGSVSQTNFKNYASLRGVGFQLVDYDMSKDVANLFYAKYGNRDSQGQCGYGTSAISLVSGLTNTMGMLDTINPNNVTDSAFWRDSNNNLINKQAVNCMGYETWFGNKSELMDNVYFNTPTANGVWNIGKSGNIRYLQGLNNAGGTYPIAIIGGRYMDIVGASVGGSTSTYYYDNQSISGSTGRVVYRSNDYASANGGVACLNTSSDSSYSHSNIGSRLAFRGAIVWAQSVSAYKALTAIT